MPPMDYDDAGFSGGEEETDNECYSDDDGITADLGQGESNNDCIRDFQILAQPQVVAELNKVAQETSQVIGFPVEVCKILLHKFRWNKEDLCDKFCDAADPAEFISKLKISLNTDKATVGQPQQLGLGLCTVCFDNLPLLGLTCKHGFCSDCWNGYLTSRFAENPEPYAPCPHPDCDMVVDDECALKFLVSPAAQRSYKRKVTNSFVECNNLLRNCPAPDCEKVIKVPHAECRAVICDCGMCFCFACSMEWHEPVTCELLKKWQKKCSDDSETSNWLNANTKDCPKCHVTIEKDGGCNHMTCRSQTCKHEFCWMCLGPWKPHGSGWYSCNRYEDGSSKNARSVQENSRAALQRYLHYYNRFMNHQSSLKLENKLIDQIKVKAEQMQSQQFSWIETQFLTNAVTVLNKCRRTLMYTYAFAFYLVPSNATQIFENNQCDLEMATEQLSEVLEREIESSEDFVALKQKVQDKYRYVDQRRVVLLKHCTEGLERNEWQFNDRP
uniref:RBR-type E3 ubiquitin transferase n=1 Tax=Panagrellus redivivus TaxID=6233 RepID=A0A7E4VR74_PANRE